MTEKRTEVGAVGSFESASPSSLCHTKVTGKTRGRQSGTVVTHIPRQTKQYLTSSDYFLLLVLRSLVYDQIYPGTRGSVLVQLKLL